MRKTHWSLSRHRWTRSATISRQKLLQQALSLIIILISWHVQKPLAEAAARAAEEQQRLEQELAQQQQQQPAPSPSVPDQPVTPPVSPEPSPQLPDSGNTTPPSGTSLGVFKITHYCACPICCGEYSNGITASGTTAQAGRTIAVDPSLIPLGSSVVINGHTYVAEDTGGAIKRKPH